MDLQSSSSPRGPQEGPSLEPYVWGPSYWNTLHFISATYSNNPNESVKTSMKNFIQTLPVLLPCRECQDNALSFLKAADLDKVVQSRKELFTFFFNFHNTVNQRLNKPSMKIEDALVRYRIPREEYTLYSVLSTERPSGKLVLMFILGLGLILFALTIRPSGHRPSGHRP